VLEDTICISNARNQRPAVLQKNDFKIVIIYRGHSHHVITIALSPLIELRDEESMDFSAPNIETAKSGSGKLHSKVDIGFLQFKVVKRWQLTRVRRSEGIDLIQQRKIQTLRRLPMFLKSTLRVASFQEENFEFQK
jgi:hypothetical protein